MQVGIEQRSTRSTKLASLVHLDYLCRHLHLCISGLYGAIQMLLHYYFFTLVKTRVGKILLLLLLL